MNDKYRYTALQYHIPEILNHILVSFHPNRVLKLKLFIIVKEKIQKYCSVVNSLNTESQIVQEM